MNTALAIFAKTPLPGNVKTRLTPPLTGEESAELYRCMLLDTLSRVTALDLDTVIFYDGESSFFSAAAPAALLLPQSEGGLGERLVAAFAALQARGYQAAVVIGSDAPDLPLSFIHDAVQRLGEGADAVFGPADDGGYYLVALRGSHPLLFRDIPWSSSGVLAASLERAREGGLDAHLLHPWYDVDCYADLSRPGLVDPASGAPLTRDFIVNLMPGQAQNG